MCDGCPRPRHAAAVTEAVEAIAPAAYAKRVHVVKQLGPAPGELYGDPARLQQALTNLLSNAIKFTPVGVKIGASYSPDARSASLEERRPDPAQTQTSAVGIGLRPIPKDNRRSPVNGA